MPVPDARIGIDCFSYDYVHENNYDASKHGFEAFGLKAESLPNPNGGTSPAASNGWRPVKAALDVMRGVVSLEKTRYHDADAGFDLDLTYVTPRVLALGFPAEGKEGLYRNPMTEVQRFLEARHAGRYRVYNLCCERAYAASSFADRVGRYPFQDHSPPPLHMLPLLCADMAAWLDLHVDNVVAIHCEFTALSCEGKWPQSQKFLLTRLSTPELPAHRPHHFHRQGWKGSHGHSRGRSFIVDRFQRGCG